MRLLSTYHSINALHSASALFANLQTTLVGLEACGGAHFLGRTLREQGHDVKLIPAQFVKPFVKSNKNDFIDAKAIAEAMVASKTRFRAGKPLEDTFGTPNSAKEPVFPSPNLSVSRL